MEEEKTGISQEEYDNLIKPYEEALTIIQIRLDSLNAEYRSRSREYPIHNIQQRIKSKPSIMKKLEKKNLTVSATVARDELTDIAGIRVICYFEDDIYSVVSAIRKLNTYGGCIIADSVGLGKMFEALAIIKYFEIGMNRVLVLTPAKLYDN